jgi:hypothetical protein
MSVYQFTSEWYQVVLGWDALQQRHYMDIYERGHEEHPDPIFRSERLLNPAMTLEQMVDTLDSYGITAPPSVLAEVRQDALLTRGDFDVHYDPETGTASIQAEFGDREDNDALDFRVKSPEQAVRDGYELEVLYPRDFGEELAEPSAQNPVETSRIRELVDRVSEWFHRGHDRGMDL